MNAQAIYKCNLYSISMRPFGKCPKNKTEIGAARSPVVIRADLMAAGDHVGLNDLT